MRRGHEGRRVFVGLIAAVATIVVASIWVMRSPVAERERKLDERRVEDLASIRQWVDRYWLSRKSLPTSLGVLSRDPVGAMVPTDPATGAQYEYRVTGERQYELCATFAREVGEDQPDPAATWPRRHGAGRQCAVRDIPADR